MRRIFFLMNKIFFPLLFCSISCGPSRRVFCFPVCGALPAATLHPPFPLSLQGENLPKPPFLPHTFRPPLSKISLTLA